MSIFEVRVVEVVVVMVGSLIVVAVLLISSYNSNVKAINDFFYS